MKYSMLQNYFKFVFIVTTLVLMFGCGSGSGPGTGDTVSKVVSVSVSPSGNGEYIIQGNNLDGVSGIELTLNYDSAAMATPTVTQSAFTSGAIMASNTTGAPGLIRIAIITTKPFSGSGQIATVTFATQSGTAGIRSISVKLIDNKGAAIPCKADLI